MLHIVKTFLVGEGLKISQLTNLLHFHFIYLILPFLSFEFDWFMPLDGLIINILLSLLKPIVEDSSMFEMRGYLFPQIGKISRIKSPVNNILLLAMILIKSRIKRLVIDIAVLMRRNKIDLDE